MATGIVCACWQTERVDHPCRFRFALYLLRTWDIVTVNLIVPMVPILSMVTSGGCQIGGAGWLGEAKPHFAMLKLQMSCNKQILAGGPSSLEPLQS